MSDKIRISLDEVNSSLVDQRLQRQSAAGRAVDHYEQRVGSAAAVDLPWTKLLYNSLIYMGLFGLVGGILAWTGGEVVKLLIPIHERELGRFATLRSAILDKLTRGEITQQDADQEIDRLQRRIANNPFAMILANQSLGPEERHERWVRLQARDEIHSGIQQTLWFAILGICLATFLSIGDDTVSKNWRGVIVNGSVGITLGMVGGVLVSLFINRLFTWMVGGDDEALVRQIAARSIGWAILGGFVTIAPGVVLRNRKRLLIGLAGGIIGGAIGGLLFDPIYLYVVSSDVVSRLVGIAAIGLFAGVGTGVIEQAAKSGWLRVVAGLIAGKQFVLYKNPTFIGSSPQCEIYLFKDPAIDPRHAAIHKVPGGYDIEDLNSATQTFVNESPIRRTRLKSGDQVRIGGTVFVFQERARK